MNNELNTLKIQYRAALNNLSLLSESDDGSPRFMALYEASRTHTRELHARLVALTPDGDSNEVNEGNIVAFIKVR